MKTQMPFNNEIEEVKAQLKVLQSKLSFLEELSKTKTPVEEAFKKVYGCYPPTTSSPYNYDLDTRWSIFQAGYNASKEECEVEEPKPDTLYNALDKLDRPMFIDDVCKVVELWVPDEFNCDDGDYDKGWNDAIRTTKQNLR